MWHRAFLTVLLLTGCALCMLLVEQAGNGDYYAQPHPPAATLGSDADP